MSLSKKRTGVDSLCVSVIEISTLLGETQKEVSFCARLIGRRDTEGRMARSTTCVLNINKGQTKEKEEMKNCTLFALIGWILSLLMQVFYIVLDFMSHGKLQDFYPVLSYISSAIVFIANISMIVFFASLYSRQK